MRRVLPATSRMMQKKRVDRDVIVFVIAPGIRLNQLKVGVHGTAKQRFDL